MGRVTNESLEFAKKHLNRYYISDFFPDPIELEAVWSQWEFVKARLLMIDITEGYETHALTALPWRKHRGGYRIVHQLEATDCLIYVALAYLAANRIEQSRKPIESGIACAYRIQIDEGSYFSRGNGFETYRDRSKALAGQYQFVLLSDIVDFYNQIYLHRLQNSIASAANASAELATDIERFLSKLNQRNSQGVPVGPAPSIVFSEATLTDVDNFLEDLGVEHTRYVDDFRIYGDNVQHLEKIQRELTLYLHKVHRLTLSSEKTRILATESFVATELENHYELEKAELFSSFESGGDYVPAIGETLEAAIEDKNATDDDYAQVPASVADKALEFALHKAKVIEAFTGLCDRSNLDLGLARVLLRQGRFLKLPELVDLCFDHFELLRPVLNSVAFYLVDVTEKYGKDAMGAKLQTWVINTSQLSDLERIWIEWAILKQNLFEISPALKQFINKSQNISSQAQMAFKERNVAWVRKYKDEVFALSPQSLRAVIYASRVLPDDERKPWLKQLKRSLTGIVDIALVDWAINYVDFKDSFDDLFDDDMPF